LGAAAAQERWTAGLASVDITPAYPIRLSGYAARTSESTGIAQRLHAKALALGAEEPVLLLTVDNCGVPWNVREEVLQRLKRKAGIDSERLAICSTHTHSAPLLAGYLHNLFYPDIPEEQKTTVSRYTRELTDALEQAALQALGNRRQATLTLARTKAGFAANRRTKGGPVDHQLPALFIRSEGKLTGILATYACHCTTLTGEFNEICGDWAGFARESLEKSHPGAVVMISIGCGADANPSPRPGFDLAKQHGEEIAGAINALQPADFSPLTGRITPRAEQVFLPFDTLPSRAEWEKRANEKNHIGQQARWNLERLDRGESLQTRQPYLVQTWSFGESLAMVFLPGEVVVDYSLRLRQELEPSKLWVHGYANDVPCYIPSERILKEGGYEGGGAMVYYDKPTRFAPGIENLIVHAVQKQLPGTFKRASQPGADASIK
jgi:hypothetical protein